MGVGIDITAVPGLAAVSRSIAPSVVVRANEAPTAIVTVGDPAGLTAAVSGSVTALDQGTGSFRYGPELFSTFKGGLVSLSASTGWFTYTPSEQARHVALVSTDLADKFDSFTVTISDLYGRTTETDVTVEIAASKIPPTAVAKLGLPATNGIVCGRIEGVAQDGGSLTYTLVNSSNPADSTEESAYSRKGGLVQLEPETGRFVFIPRISEAVIPALDTDSFVVTAVDERGGIADVTVRPLAHLRMATETTGTAPGVQHGRLSVSTDGSTGPLQFRLGVPPGKGRVRVTRQGNYLYTRTPGLGHGVSAADSFTIVGTDDYGRTLTVAQVRVCPPLSDALPDGIAHIAESWVNGLGVQTTRGRITATDNDGGPLRFTSPQGCTVTSAKGCTVTFDAEGAFVYSSAQNSTLGHRAASTKALAGDKVDTFTVTATNWLGHSNDLVVPVNLLPYNNVPMQGTVGASGRTSSLNTGEWTTTVIDADGDDITYAVIQDDPWGTVSVHSNTPGTFVVTYTSTSAKVGAHHPSETFSIRFYDGHTASDGTPAFAAAIYTF